MSSIDSEATVIRQGGLKGTEGVCSDNRQFTAQRVQKG